MTLLTRRTALIGAAAGSGLVLAGCDKILQAGPLTDSAGFQKVLAAAEGWTRHTQRFLLSGGAMAKEFEVSDITPNFKANGTLHPGGDEYARAIDERFANWRLVVDGMVARPLSLSVAQLRALPARTQITRHDCVEGWSAIGQWTGTPRSAPCFTPPASRPARATSSFTAPTIWTASPRRAAPRLRASTTKASPWPTPSIRRPSSPTP